MSTIGSNNYPVTQPEVAIDLQMVDTLYHLKEKLNLTINNIQDLLNNDISLDSAVQLTYSSLMSNLTLISSSLLDTINTSISTLTTKHNSELLTLQNQVNNNYTELSLLIAESKTYQ